MVKIRKSTSPSGTVGQSSTEKIILPSYDPVFLDRSEKWIIASWVDSHVCGNVEYFTELEPIDYNARMPVRPDRKTVAYPIAKGTIAVEMKRNGKPQLLSMSGVFYVPGSPNLISLTHLHFRDYFLDLPKKMLTNALDADRNIPFWEESGLLYVKFRPVLQHKASSVRLENIFKPSELAMIYHLRIGHSPKDILLAAANSNLLSVNTEAILALSCKFCIQAPKAIKADEDKLKPGELLYVHATEQAISCVMKNRISFLIQDKGTGFMWAIAAKDSKDAAKQLKGVCKTFSTDYKRKIHTIKFANAANAKILERVQKVGKKLEIVVLAYQHDVQANQEVVTAFSNVLDRMATILVLADLPLTIWNQALFSAVYMHNVLPFSATVEMTPYEQLKGNKQSLDHMKIIGSTAIPYNPKLNKTGKWVLVGFSETNKYTLYNKVTGNVVHEEDAFIYEEELFLPYFDQDLKSPTPKTSAAKAVLMDQVQASMPAAPPSISVPQNSITYSSSKCHNSLTPKPSAAKAVLMDQVQASMPAAPPSFSVPQNSNTYSSSKCHKSPTPKPSAAPAVLMDQGQASKPAAPPSLSIPDNSNNNSSSKRHKMIPKKDLKFIFEALEKAAISKQNICTILEPFEKRLLQYELQAKLAVPYAHTAGLQRSKSFEPFEFQAKWEFEPLETIGNGDCLFNALSLILYGNQTNSAHLRLLLLRHVLLNWDILQLNCLQIFQKSLKGLVQSIINRWGTDSHIFLFSEVLGYPIFSVQLLDSYKIRNDYYNSDPVNSYQPGIYLFLHNDHWEPLVPKTNQPLSVKKATCYNFYSNVTHKYIFNGNQEVSLFTYLELEQARTKYPDRKLVREDTPSTINLTDVDDVDAEKIFSCVNCKSKNEKLKEQVAHNARLRKELNKRNITTLPLYHCKTCEDVTKRANALEAEKNRLRIQFNKHGESLVKQISELQYNLESMNQRNKDLQEGHDLMKNVLAKRNEDKVELERQLDILGTELENVLAVDLTIDWKRDPSHFSPIMTPGRNDLNQTKIESGSGILTLNHSLSSTSSKTGSTSGSGILTLNPSLSSTNSKTGSASGSGILTLEPSLSSTSSETGSESDTNCSQNKTKSPHISTPSLSPAHRIMTPELAGEIEKLVATCDNTQQTLTPSEISRFLNRLDNQDYISQAPVDLYKDLSLSPSTIEGSQNAEPTTSDIKTDTELNHDSDSDTDCYESSDKENRNNSPAESETDWYEPSDDEIIDNSDAAEDEKKWNFLKKCRVLLHKLNKQTLGTWVPDKSARKGQNQTHGERQCIFCSQRIASLELYYTHLKDFHQIDQSKSCKNPSKLINTSRKEVQYGHQTENHENIGHRVEVPNFFESQREVQYGHQTGNHENIGHRVEVPNFFESQREVQYGHQTGNHENIGHRVEVPNFFESQREVQYGHQTGNHENIGHRAEVTDFFECVFCEARFNRVPIEALHFHLLIYHNIDGFLTQTGSSQTPQISKTARQSKSKNSGSRAKESSNTSQGKNNVYKRILKQCSSESESDAAIQEASDKNDTDDTEEDNTDNDGSDDDDLQQATAQELTPVTNIQKKKHTTPSKLKCQNMDLNKPLASSTNHTQAPKIPYLSMPSLENQNLPTQMTSNRQLVNAGRRKKTGMVEDKTNSPFKCVLCSQEFALLEYYHNHLAYYHDVDRVKQSKQNSKTYTHSYQLPNKSIIKLKLPFIFKKNIEGLPTSQSSNSCNPEIVDKPHAKTKRLERPSKSIKKPDTIAVKKKTEGLHKPSKKQSHKKNPSEIEKPFHCHLCDKKYTANNSLKRHLETHSEVRVPCRYCPKTFRTHENLVKHAKNLHQGDRKQQCRFCPHLVTKSKAAMTTHEKSKHLNEWLALQGNNNDLGAESNGSEAETSSEEE